MKRVILLLGLLAGSAMAHEVHLAQSQQTAAVVRLTYADGKPFAFEAYELYPVGQEIPAQVGRTNGDGQVIFLPGTQGDWRLKAYSADGHGVDQSLKVSGGSGEAVAAGNAGNAGELPRGLLLAAGLGIVFGLFGLVQLFFRKKSS
jgi:nickel transport protein